MSEPTLEAPPDSEFRDPDASPLGRVPWTIADSIAVFALHFVVMFGIFLILGGGIDRLYSRLFIQTLALPLTAVTLVAVTLLYVRRYPGAFTALLGPGRVTVRRVGAGLLGGVLAAGIFGVAWARAVEMVVRELGREMPPVQESIQEVAAGQSTAPVLLFTVVLLTPVAEELFFRGMLFAALRQRFVFWPAAGLTAVVFAFGHAQTQLAGTLYVAIVIIPLSILLAWLYERTRTLAAPMAAHAAFNLIQALQLLAQTQG